MIFGMSIWGWLPWIIGFVAVLINWWVGIVYWGKHAEDDDKD